MLSESLNYLRIAQTLCILSQITQRYAYHAVKESAAQQGFQVAEERNQADGSIKLVVQRWSA